MICSLDVIPTVVQSAAPYSKHVTKWNKDHPLDNIIGELKRPVSIRLQLHEQALFCYYNAFLSSVEPKNYKDALTQSCWIEAMQEELNEFEHLEEFSKGTVDPTLFIRRQGKDLLMVQIYIDDIIFASTTPELCDQFSKIMCSQFKMSMMGKISFFLGLQISQSPRGIFINQSKYALESLKKYGMESSDPMDTPMVEKSKLDEDTQGKAADPTLYRGMIGTLMYLIASRSDLTFVVCMCAWYQEKPTEKHLHAVKRIFKYLRAEYIAMSGCCAQILWMRSQLTDYGLGFNKIPMYRDNKSAIALCCSNVQHSRSKHTDIRFHFIKEKVENGVVELYFVNTEYQLEDIFTKALCRERIEFLINKLGMRSFTPETLKQLADEAEE
ncbi:retrovirus-related pol polyprotein from transposon TNT 1-94 [Tanacetum coccineum]